MPNITLGELDARCYGDESVFSTCLCAVRGVTRGELRALSGVSALLDTVCDSRIASQRFQAAWISTDAGECADILTSGIFVSPLNLNLTSRDLPWPSQGRSREILMRLSGDSKMPEVSKSAHSPALGDIHTAGNCYEVRRQSQTASSCAQL